MARQPIKKRASGKVVSAERGAYENRMSSDPVATVASDIASGVKELGRQGKAAAESIKGGYRRLKKFTTK